MPRKPISADTPASLRSTYRAVIGPASPIPGQSSVARQVGTGQAYQAVAQSSALVVQDAASFLRNLTTMSQAAMAVVLIKMLENPTEDIPKYSPLLPKLQSIMQSGVQFFGAVGQTAGQVLGQFPST
jgi:hypothetical protein